MPTFRADDDRPEQATPDAPARVHPRESSSQAPTSVGRLNETIHGFVQRWGSVWVTGELTSWNQRGGAVYGRLKDLDTDALLSFRLWSNVRARLTDTLAVGDRVVACVKADYWARGGDFSFQVSQMRHAGIGDQLERLERLRAQLRAEGLFDPARKKPIPFLPHGIGLITGERSDAEKDVRRNAELRWPHVRLHTVYAAVQGERCVPETLAALARLDADPEVDVIIIARGGGDPQTLLGFSDERLIRAVAAASTPVVSAIGHENDHPLLDEVADLRASTPTDAAKRVVPDVGEQRALVAELRARMRTRLTARVNDDIARLEQIRSRPVLRDPAAMLTGRSQDLWLLVARGRDRIDRTVREHEQRLVELRASVRALSPGATLARGYAIAQDETGRILREAAQAPDGQALSITLEHGVVRARSLGAAATDESAVSAPRTKL